MKRLFRHPMAVFGVVFLGLMVGLAVFAEVIAVSRGIDVGFMMNFMNANQPPSFEFWLGTDQLGRDIFTLTSLAARVSLLFALGAAGLAAVIGVIIGLIAGNYGGWVDAVLMRFTDGIIALPLLPLLIVLAAIDPVKIGISEEIAYSENFAIIKLVILVALVGWVRIARLVRAGALAARGKDYVMAVHALGAKERRIMWFHILPNVISPVIISTTLSIGAIILLEASLSFLGFGIPATTPSWGSMLQDSEALIFGASMPWPAIWPGLALFLTVISFNFLGDGLQDALDPRG